LTNDYLSEHFLPVVSKADGYDQADAQTAYDESVKALCGHHFECEWGCKNPHRCNRNKGHDGECFANLGDPVMHPQKKPRAQTAYDEGMKA
jgi:hypothetical protein